MSKARIYCRLVGGLGNQLFQYAAARALALRNGFDLILDTRAYTAERNFDYGLDKFAIRAKTGTESNLPPAKSKPLRYAAWRLFGSSPRFVREQGLGFNANIVSIRANVYLHGYFQTEKYFADHAGQIRSELTLTEPPGGENERWLEMIAGSPCPVSLHVRRGDYVSSAKGEAAHGTCSPDYYSRAVDFVAAESEHEPVIHVFSDDPAWARENLKFTFQTRYADHNDRFAAHEDLRLMAACKHNIIANSTFSWWGAWLNPHPGKIVVAPQRWFADPRLRNPDICLKSWLRF